MNELKWSFPVLSHDGKERLDLCVTLLNRGPLSMRHTFYHLQWSIEPHTLHESHPPDRESLLIHEQQCDTLNEVQRVILTTASLLKTHWKTEYWIDVADHLEELFAITYV